MTRAARTASEREGDLVRHLTKGIAALALCFLPLVAACNKGPADAALKEAEQALASAPDIERYAPAEFTAITATIRDARADLDAGRYTDALRSAQALPDRILAAGEAAGKSKQQEAAAWNDLAAGLPTQIEGLTARLTALAAANALPKETLAAVQGELASLTQTWGEATTAFEAGDIPKAVAAAQEGKAKAESLAGRVGLKPRPAAPASAPPPPARLR
jgi:phage shock protein A